MTLLADAPTTSRSLLLEQDIRYEYTAPIAGLRQRLVVIPPPVHGMQVRGEWSLSVTGVDTSVRRRRMDRFGNVVIDVAAPWVERWIEFSVVAAVERLGPDGPHTIPVDPRFLRATPLTTADDHIRDLVTPGTGPADICARASRSLTYEWGVTGVRTSAVEAIRGGQGVCQDFAHIMIAACRAAGIAARYVSGHLVGEGGSHAWVETLLPDPRRPGTCVVEAWDPTHDRPAGDGYLTVAVGRDYADIAPMSGNFVAAGASGAAGQLFVRKRLVSS